MNENKHAAGYLARGLGTKKWFVIILALALLHVLPWTIPSHFIHMMIMIFIFTIMGQGWNVLGGYVGQFSFGHALFFGIGAYTSTLLFLHLGLSPWFGIIIACMASIAVGLFVGLLSFRYGLSGPFFALIMLAFAEIFHITFITWKAVGGSLGLLIPSSGNAPLFMQFTDKIPFYYISLWFMAAALYVVWRFEKSRTGLYFMAVREDKDAAEALGINTFKSQMIAMAISAGMTAIGGTIYAQYLLYIDPDITFGSINSVEIMIRPIIGGPGTVLGPLLGSVVLTPLSEFTREVFQAYSGVYLMIYGIVLVVVIMFLPDGIIGFANRMFEKFRTH